MRWFIVVEKPDVVRLQQRVPRAPAPGSATRSLADLAGRHGRLQLRTALVQHLVARVAVLVSAAVVCATIWLWKIAPSTAMPVAMPTWRNVLLAPEAMPLRCGCTTETAPEASTGFTIADPECRRR